MQIESTKAPRGQLYYIVTDPPTAHNRRYLYQLKWEKGRLLRGATFAPFRVGARAWDDKQLADVFCRFLCGLENKNLHVVLEAGAR